WQRSGSPRMIAAFEAKVRAQGIDIIRPDEAFRALESVLRTNVPQVIVMKARAELLHRWGATVDSYDDADRVATEALLETATRRALRGLLGRAQAFAVGPESAGDLIQRLAIVPAHARLLNALLNRLVQAGWLRCSEDDAYSPAENW